MQSSFTLQNNRPVNTAENTINQLLRRLWLREDFIEFFQLLWRCLSAMKQFEESDCLLLNLLSRCMAIDRLRYNSLHLIHHDFPLASPESSRIRLKALHFLDIGNCVQKPATEDIVGNAIHLLVPISKPIIVSPRHVRF